MSDYISKFLAYIPKDVKNNWILILIAVVGFLYLFNYFKGKGSYGIDRMETNDNVAYQMKRDLQGMGPEPSADTTNMSCNEQPASVNASSIIQPQAAGSMQNPSDLLPGDNNSEWAQLNPAGQGDLANINLLKAGYHIGIDTVGQTLRNANLQIRSEPPNPQVNVSPWMQSTISPDLMRIPLELGQGGQ
jgi:hypothetical protein